ncbi:MAG: nicotinate (nicotinamide) nucleotide adenylyltransferase [Candidatus Levyibacteriota bacterium]
MKIGILGGSFDPPHVGHVLISRQVKEKLQLDMIWLMPAYHHPFAKQLLSSDYRLAMTRLLEEENIKVSDYEIKQNHSSYTIDTLTQLHTAFPDDTFYWITGSDQLDSFQKYKEWQTIITEFNLVIFPRETAIAHLEEKTKACLQLQTIPPNIILLQDSDLILTNISSTLVRTRLAKNEPLDYIIPNKVVAYIRKHKLYQ